LDWHESPVHPPPWQVEKESSTIESTSSGDLEKSAVSGLFETSAGTMVSSEPVLLSVVSPLLVMTSPEEEQAIMRRREASETM